MKKSSVFISLLLLVVLVSPVFAFHEREVLGDSTTASDINFPPITAGPGFILPDSPLYPLDLLSQKIKLALVFSADNRAAVHNQIAGERMAELRVMVSRNNQVGIDTALMQLQQETTAAAADLKDAAAQGKDVAQLARTINDTIAMYRSDLLSVSAQTADTAFSQKLLAANEVLKENKSIAQDELPDADRQNEIAASITENVDESVLGIATDGARLSKELDLYQQYASQAAQERLQAQQDALQKLLQNKHASTTAKQQRQLVEQRLKLLQQLQQERQKYIQQLQQAIQTMQQSAQGIKQTQQAELDTLETQLQIQLDQEFKQSSSSSSSRK
jgi:hypothetical protein